MTLEQDVYQVYFAERERNGSARLDLHEVAVRVARIRWKRLSASDKVVSFMRGTNLRPSDEEVHDAVHELQKTHRNLVSLRRTAHPRVATLRIVHSR